MPTDVVSTIGATSSPTTPAYSTLQAWEDACPANLVTDDKRWIGECLNQGEFTGGTLLTIGGQTVDATRYVILRCAAGASFKDNASVRSNALTYNAANGVAMRRTSGVGSTIVAGSQYTRIEGIQLSNDGNYGRMGVAAINVRLDSCIFKAVADTAVDGASGAAIVINCVAITSGARAFDFSFGSNFHGCTAVRPSGTGTAAFHVQYNATTIKNCAGFGFGTVKTGSATDGGRGYNATDLASAYGSNNVTSLTLADQFENAANDFRAIGTGDLQAGTPDATNTPEDISGLTRDATTPWIGCWDVEGGGGSTASGAGSASGTGTATGVGAPTAASAGTASGVGAATGEGASTATATGSAAGASAASGFAPGTSSADGSASGSSTASGAGASTATSTGASSGTGSASGIGGAIFAGPGSASGFGSASGAGACIFAGAGLSTGVSAVAGVGKSTVASAGTAAGTCVVLGYSGEETAAGVLLYWSLNRPALYWSLNRPEPFWSAS